MVAKESLPIAAVIAVAAAAGGFLIHAAVAAAGLPALLFTLWFFRDPERATPRAPDALISPADGRIIRVGPDKVSIFMNVFDVHVCRAPFAGTVETADHHPGRFLAAYKDRASEHNERVSIVLANGARRLRFTLVAGLVARRIVCKVAPGQRLEAGQRVGLIQFGSRVDVDLPADAEVTVVRGQRVKAGETPIIRLRGAGQAEAPAGARRADGFPI
jgi:phosphatidylserine decarboxylase